MHRTSIIGLSLACAATLCGACADEQVYVGDGKLYQVALTETTAPAFQARDGALYIVEQRAVLPYRAPTADELKDLRDGARAYKNLPFPRLPWIERDDDALQVDFTLSNLDKSAHDVDVTINGANEFDEYFPGVVIVEDNPLPMHAQWERRFSVPAGARISYTVREEELDEAAVDLATVVNGAPNPDEVVYFENKSSSDERSKKYIPKVIPGLVAMRLGLRTTEQSRMLLEATIRVRDGGSKLAEDGDKRLQAQPKAFHAMPAEAP